MQGTQHPVAEWSDFLHWHFITKTICFNCYQESGLPLHLQVLVFRMELKPVGTHVSYSSSTRHAAAVVFLNTCNLITQIHSLCTRNAVPNTLCACNAVCPVASHCLVCFCLFHCWIVFVWETLLQLCPSHPGKPPFYLRVDSAVVYSMHSAIEHTLLIFFPVF